MISTTNDRWGAEKAEMPMAEFLRLLWSRRGLFTAVTLALLGLTLLGLWLWPVSYTATTRVLIETGRAREQLSDGQNTAQLGPAFIGTQVDIIRSQRVALEAVKMLGVSGNASAISIFNEETGGRGSIDQFFADRLLARIKIRPSQQSNIIDISMRAPDPRFAAQVANAMARAYITTSLELKVKPAREFTEFFEQQTQASRERYDKAQRRLSQFQKSRGIVSVDERLDIESNRLQELSTQLTQIQALRSESAEKADSANRSKGSASALPEVINNSVVMQLKAEIARNEAKLAELSGQFGPNYPQVERLRDELAGLRRELRAQTDAVGGSMSRQFEVNVARESETRAALDRQRQKVMNLKQQRDEMNMLARDVDSAKHSLDLLTQRLLQHSVESESRGANVVQLDPAVEPLEPSSPNRIAVLTAGVVAAPLISAMVVALTGLFSRRALSDSDIETALGCPVIAHVPRSPSIARGASLWRKVRNRALSVRQLPHTPSGVVPNA